MAIHGALRTALALFFASALSAGVVRADDAGPLNLDEYRGQVVVVDFWASWCTPCRRSFPWLDAMQRKYGDAGLVIVGINEDNSAEDAAAFLESNPVAFRIVADRNGSIAREFEVIAMPSTYVIDRSGQLAERHLGFKTAKQDEYEAVLLRLLFPEPAKGPDD